MHTRVTAGSAYERGYQSENSREFTLAPHFFVFGAAEGVWRFTFLTAFRSDGVLRERALFVGDFREALGYVGSHATLEVPKKFRSS